MKKFVRKVAILALPLIILLVLVNYFVDAARLFDDKFEKQMVKILASGRYITNIENYDERLFQKEIISNKRVRPKLVVIGSSRTMLLSSDQFPGASLFNNSVSGASIEDLISIVQLYKAYNKLPSKIIIGIDPWTFNENSGQKRWQTLSAYYYSFKHLQNPEHSTCFKYKELFSLSYFQSSLKTLPRMIAGGSNPKPTAVKYNLLGTKLTDGSLVYGEHYRNANSEEIENKIKTYLTGAIYGIEKFYAISDRIWNDFERLIYDLEENNIEIEFILTPYAPMVYEKIRNNYPMVLKTEEAISSFAINRNIKLYGSFNPLRLNMDKSYFYDGMHCNEDGIKKIMRVNKLNAAAYSGGNREVRLIIYFESSWIAHASMLDDIGILLVPGLFTISAVSRVK